MRNALKKRLVWVLAVIVGIPALLYVLATAYFVFVPAAEDYAHRTDSIRPGGEVGLLMKILFGRRASAWWMISLPTSVWTASRVVKSSGTLGSGDQTAKWRDWHLIYHLGPERRGLFRIDSEWLVIQFDHFE